MREKTVNRSARWLRIGEWFLNHRWWIVALGSLSIFGFEFLEHQPLKNGVSTGFLFEMTFYGIILPVSTGLALTKLVKSRTELAWSLYSGDLKRNLNIQLNNLHSHTELAEVIFQFLKVILPLAWMELYKYEQRTQNYQIILNSTLRVENVKLDTLSQFSSENYAVRNESLGVDKNTLQTCLEQKEGTLLNSPSCYCFPFYFSNIPVALACLYMSPGNKPTQEQIRLLKEVAPEIALTFQRIQLERLADVGGGEVLSVEQQRIARDVHDTLGHSLAYLRLRLDQISMEIQKIEVDILKQEVEDLRDVAKEAYHQMRNILIMLSPDELSKIDVNIENFVTKIQERANFELRFQTYGQARGLPHATLRNIYFIFQEALANIEAHANAKKVNVELKWNASSLDIRVCDDGIGFNTDLLLDGHFGLNNMRERAAECNAELSITSQVGQGTQVVLKVPYEGNE